MCLFGLVQTFVQSFIYVKRESKFSEKSVFLAEIVNEKRCIFESQILIDCPFQSAVLKL